MGANLKKSMPILNKKFDFNYMKNKIVFHSFLVVN